jgi:hypothetical protein
MESYIAAAPEPLRQALSNSLATYNEEKSRLVDAILANKNHGFTKDDLSNRPLSELKNLAALAGVQQSAPRVANYAGQANVPAQNDQSEEAMEIPIMNFDKQPETAAK